MSISGRKQNMSTGSKKRRTANLRRKRGMTIRKTGSLSKEFKTNDRSVYAPVQLIPKRENQKDTAKKIKNANQRKTNNLQKTVPLVSDTFLGRNRHLKPPMYLSVFSLAKKGEQVETQKSRKEKRGLVSFWQSQVVPVPAFPLGTLRHRSFG